MSANAAVLNLPTRRPAAWKARGVAAAIVVVLVASITALIVESSRSTSRIVPRPVPSEVIGTVPGVSVNHSGHHVYPQVPARHRNSQSLLRYRIR
jgi:hypothetical protein